MPTFSTVNVAYNVIPSPFDSVLSWLLFAVVSCWFVFVLLLLVLELSFTVLLLSWLSPFSLLVTSLSVTFVAVFFVVILSDDILKSFISNFSSLSSSKLYIKSVIPIYFPSKLKFKLYTSCALVDLISSVSVTPFFVA